MSGRRDQAQSQPQEIGNFRRLASDKDVEEALLFLRDSGDTLKKIKLTIARSKLILERMEAEIFGGLADTVKGYDARRLMVKADPRWKAAMEKLVEAEAELVGVNADREYHKTIIEVWQSEGANLRAMRI